MVKQSIIDKSELTNFLASGAILQVGLDQFKLIWGPFTPVALGQSLISDEKTVIYQPDFWDFTLPVPKKNTALVGVKQVNLDKEQLLNFLSQQEQVEPAVENQMIHWGEVSEQEFTAQFQWSQSQFKAKQLIKTVPIISQSGAVHFSKAMLARCLMQVISGNHYGSTYGLWDSGEGYLGHTPELILDYYDHEETLRTMALAGTMDQRQESAQKILHDVKILDEHQIVVQDLVETLEKVNTSKRILVDPTNVLALKHLHHLQTEIRIQPVQPDQVFSYLQAIHPTAALGLYPRKAEQYEEFKKFDLQKIRRNFAAPFAFMTKSHVKAVAAIRFFFFNATEVQIMSGCGVTAGSVLADEIKELENKRNSVKRMMGFAE